jgi:two-component system OmpR family sensor kinase/two-component system sensor histidine kinase BaeS
MNERRAPVVVQGREVGVLVLDPSFGPPVPPGAWREHPGSTVWPIWRGFLLGVSGLTLLLVLVAFVLARWLSRPLRTLTFAAEQMAGGQLDVQVPPAGVREMDDLATAFNRMSAALVAADAQRRQMTADTAHELRTPLSIIKGRLEGIQDGVYAAGPEQIGQLLRETELLERLVEDLRVLALADAGRLPLFVEPIDPCELLERTAATFSAQATSQGVAISIDMPDDLPLLQIDPQRMMQVFANLVSNALRYTPGGGTITLGARLERTPSPALPDAELLAGGAAVMMFVADSGQGVAAEDLPHIFDRFWRSDRSRARGSGGAGLGLAIVRRIVEAHDGTIDASSEPGRGTTFTMRLPAAE